MRIFTKESLETLKQRIDLVEVISPNVNLKRSGACFKGLCPFHEEKTSSFVIQKGDTHYHCFGCGAHGDAIEFLMSYQKMSFVETVEFLAEKFGVVLEQKEDNFESKGSDKTLLKEALRKASDFFQFMLLYSEEGHEALAYLYSRGMDLDFIKTFEIGYAPKAGGLFQKTMAKHKIKSSLLEEVGLLKTIAPLKIKDFFNDRIVIPIKNAMGMVIGFSARKFKEETFGPKYINTPETVLFKKSKVLFGLSYCRKKIAKERRTIIVEGQFDALRLIYEGISIAVAGQGTAFGKEHIQELLNLGVNKVYLALDSDKAGQEATLKIGHLFQKEAIEVFVVSLSEEDKDPDTFIQEKGPEDFLKLLSSCEDYLSFMVKFFSKTLDLNSPAAKNELLNTLISRIKEWEHPLMVHESLKKIARLTNTPESILNIKPFASPNVLIRKEDKVSSQQINPDRILEADFLRWLLLVGDSGTRFIELAKLNLKEDVFKITVCKRLYLKCLQAHQENKTLDLLSLAIYLDDAEEQLFLSELLQRKINREKAEEGFLESMQKLLDRKWMESRENIKNEIHKGNLSEEELLALAKRFDEIKNQKPQVVLSLNKEEET